MLVTLELRSGRRIEGVTVNGDPPLSSSKVFTLFGGESRTTIDGRPWITVDAEGAKVLVAVDSIDAIAPYVAPVVRRRP